MKSINDSALFRQQIYINGHWSDADSGDKINVTNPADDSILGTVPKAGATETRRAIEAAQAAFADWRARTGKERAAILRRWYELMMAH